MNDGKKTVLIIEDEAPAALALGNALQQEGYEVFTADDGEKGLQVALEKRPDVMLVDLRLPKMDGMDIVREVRKDAWGKTAHIIILTNMSDTGRLEEAMQNDTFYYLVKGDSSIADVIKAVGAQFGRSTGEAAKA
jgi:DNA-binding response OmpR family regulator